MSLTGYAGFVVGGLRLDTAEEGAVARLVAERNTIFPWNSPGKVDGSAANAIKAHGGGHFVLCVAFNANSVDARQQQQAVLQSLKDSFTDGLPVSDIAVVDRAGDGREVLLAIPVDQAARLARCLQSLDDEGRKANPGLKPAVGSR